MPNQTFARKNRLTIRREFVRLFDQPFVHKTRTFQAFWKTNDRRVPRLGITIKGRLSSIWRTRLKRIVREWFRAKKAAMEPIDLNIVLRLPEKVEWGYAELLKLQLSRWNPKQ